MSLPDDPTPEPTGAPDTVLIPRLSVVGVALLFLRLGVTGFGGPAAHIALMHDEFVVRKRWLTATEFLDLNAAANLIPGPSSTEVALHLGHRIRGLPGMVVAGCCFILPAALLVLGMAVLYQAQGHHPLTSAFLAGIKPVTVALILVALCRLAPSAAPNYQAILIALLALGLRVLGVNELLLFMGSAMAMVGIRGWWPGPLAGAGLVSGVLLRPEALPASPTTSPLALTGGATAAGLAGVAAAPSIAAIFFSFFKVGSVLYGSGYVLLPFLETELCQNQGWLTRGQVLDSVSVAQLTPGPLFTGATFAGYLIGGWSGAMAATVGIFLPGFILVALTARHLHQLRRNRILAHALDGINPAALGIMGATLITLGREALGGPLAVVWALVCLGALWWQRVHPMVLLGLGALLGMVGLFEGSR